MYARSALLSMTDEQVDELVVMFEKEMGPLHAETPGFAGLMLVADRLHQLAFGVSFWKTKEDRERTGKLGRALLDRVNEIGGLHNPAFQTWDVVYYHVPEPGLVLRSGWIVEDGLLIDTTMPAGSAPPPQVAG